MKWKFLSCLAVEAMHAEQLTRHGGAHGLRDLNALESALARAEHKAPYGEPDVAELAAAYMFGLARNHAFVDGNKRAALAASLTFLIINGFELFVEFSVLYAFVIDVAAGEIDESGATAFFRDYIKPI